MQTWAVARQMIAEGIRMRIAVVFLFLLAVVVLGLPFSIAGDASLTGAVQSFLSYGLTASGVLLAILSVFLSRSFSDELVNRHAFLVLTKPIPRWQFVLGKWLGIVCLNAAFLTFSGLAIYGMVQYIRATHPPADKQWDRTELENEVLVARHAVKTKVPDFTDPAKREFERNREEGLYANIPGFDPVKELERLVEKHEARWRIVSPLDRRMFEFDNLLTARTKDREIQLRYKTDVTQPPPDEIFRGAWRFGDPAKGVQMYAAPVRHVVGRRHTVSVPADCIAPDNTLRVEFINENPFEGEPIWNNFMEFRRGSEVEVLFIVGSFEWNLVRLLLLMFCKLVFLAAVAILCTTAFSFPVACLTAFTVYVLAGARNFLGEALELTANDTATLFTSAREFVIRSVGFVYDALCWVIPDFGRFDAVETFVNGRNVSLVWVLQGVTDLVLLKTLAVLGLAMILFYRREVAEISL